MCGNVTAQRDDTCLLLADRRATYGPYRPPLDGPFRRAKNGPSQMRRPALPYFCLTLLYPTFVYPSSSLLSFGCYLWIFSTLLYHLSICLVLPLFSPLLTSL